MDEDTDGFNVRDIVEVTVSGDRKLSDGNFGTSSVFISAKVLIPRGVDVDKATLGLLGWVQEKVDAEVTRIKGGTLKSSPEKDAGSNPAGSTTQTKTDEKKEETKTSETNEQIPVCKIHKKPMRKGTYGWYCSTKIGDGPKDYCKEKA